MKNSFFLLIIAAVLSGCSSDEILESSATGAVDENTSRPIPPDIKVDPTKLRKVIFWPGAPYQKTWTFYGNGLLRKSIDANATLTFYYDGNNNLISATRVTSTNTSNSTFVYDADNHIISVNGYPVAYDSILNKYVLYFGIPPGEVDEFPYAHRTEISLNDEGLVLNRKMFFTEPGVGEYFRLMIEATYTDGNTTQTTEQDFETVQNYQFDSNPNPFKAATLPICKAMPLLNAYQIFPAVDEWINGSFSSVNNVSHIYYSSKDPESSVMAYQYNGNNLPVRQTSQGYYFGQIDGPSIEAIRYYYQGDSIAP